MKNQGHLPDLPGPHQLFLVSENKVQRTLDVLVIHPFPAIMVINWDLVERRRRLHHNAQSIDVDPDQYCLSNPRKAHKSNPSPL
jgi:hypothetical protein